MNQLQSFFKYLSVAAAVSCLASSALAQNTVVNGGFESGFAGWTVNDPSNFTVVGTDPAFAHSGSNYAALGATPGNGSLSQVLNTVAGTTYTLSFWLANNVALPTNFFQALVNGAVVFTTTSPPFTNSGAYQLITISGILATGPTTTLAFQYRHDPDFWRLDDVAFVGPAGAGVPEGGATFWLMVPLFAGLCFYHFRLRSCRAVS